MKEKIQEILLWEGPMTRWQLLVAYFDKYGGTGSRESFFKILDHLISRGDLRRVKI
jgi:hypothetical protein